MHDHIKKTVIITGASQGIGRKIAKRFIDSGYFAVLGSRSERGLLEEFGKDRCRFVTADVRKREDHHRLAKEALSWTGRVDTWVNCAGISIWKPLHEVDEAFWQMILETNATGTFWGCQAAASAMKSGGSIINISSLAGKRGSANNSVYCASKFAVNGITQSLAKELGPSGIRVNAVCPVYVTTPNILKSLEKNESPAGGRQVDQYLSDFASSQAALKRLPQAEEIAEMCLVLAGTQSSAVTGQCINVDCGVLPQ